MKSRILSVFVVSLLIQGCLVVTGCNEKSASESKPTSAEILATVDDEKITEDDLQFSMERTFNQLDLMSLDATLRDKVLDSLIASRAMKLLLLKELSADEQLRIENLAKAYEEELYVKEYLQRYVTPAPVTVEMVKNYYQENAEEFGAETLRDFEMLKAPTNLSDSHRDQLLAETTAIKTSLNWSSSAKSWGEKWGLLYQQGRSKAGLLEKILEQRIAALGKGETSDVFYVDGQLHLVRVTNLTQASPQSLAEVSGDIRKRLAPLMLREAVKKASDEARSKVNVEIKSAITK